MDPYIWGPPFWFSLHSVTFTYPFHPDEEDKARVKNFFHSLPYVLPCKICRVHYSEHLRDHPIEGSLDCRADLVKWLIDVHNTVNQMLGKRTYTLEEVLQIYEEKHGHPISLYPHTTETIEATEITPQPHARIVCEKQNNVIYSILFGVLLLGAIYWLSGKTKRVRRK